MKNLSWLALFTQIWFLRNSLQSFSMSSWNGFLKLATHTGFPAWRSFQPARAPYDVSQILYLRETLHITCHGIREELFLCFGCSIPNTHSRTVTIGLQDILLILYSNNMSVGWMRSWPSRQCCHLIRAQCFSVTLYLRNECVIRDWCVIRCLIVQY